MQLIRELSKDAKQAEKAVKGLQTMIRKLELEMLAGRNRLVVKQFMEIVRKIESLCRDCRKMLTSF